MPSQSWRASSRLSFDPESALLGRVDQEDSAERPPGLAAEARLGLLVEDEDVLARVDQFGRGDESGEAGADDDRIRLAVWSGG